MHKKPLFVFCLLVALAAGRLNVKAISFDSAEDSLVKYALQMQQGENNQERLAGNKAFSDLLLQVLEEEKSFDYPFEKLSGISIVSSDDDAFRIFSWYVRKTSGLYLYFGAIQSYSSTKNKYLVFPLTDNSANIRIPQIEKLTYDQWYGAMYYQLVTKKHKGRKYYTLLGWKGNDALTTKKVLDVLVVSKSGKPSFGYSVFKAGRKAAKRIVFEFSAQVTMSLRYDEKKDLIIYDHLAPKEPRLEGQFQYYGPDYTYNALEFIEGKWYKIEDYDARNEKYRYRRKEMKKDLEALKQRYEAGEITNDEYYNELDIIQKRKERRKKMNIKDNSSEEVPRKKKKFFFF